MSSEPHPNLQAALLGQRGGFKRAERLTAEQRSAISRHAARARWHPREAQAERAKAQELAYLLQQALKNGNQLSLI